VLRNFTAAVHDCFVRLGKWPVDKPAPEITEYGMAKFYGMKEGEFNRIVFGLSHRSYRIFSYAPIYPEADIFFDRLTGKHTVGLITCQNQMTMKATLMWLYNNDIVPMNLHWIRFGKPKTGFGYEILLDDKPENCESFMLDGGRAFLFDRPWNQGYRGPAQRVFDYGHFLKVIDDIDAGRSPEVDLW
jgi:5'(3')-deoxyribonucleotidase